MYDIYQLFRSIDSNSVKGFPKDPRDGTRWVRFLFYHYNLRVYNIFCDLYHLLKLYVQKLKLMIDFPVICHILTYKSFLENRELNFCEINLC